MEPLNTLNATIIAFPEPIAPFIETIRSVIGTVSWILGGLFGLYLILLIIKWYQNRVLLSVLKDIRYDLNRLNEHFKVKYRQPKKRSRLAKIISKIWEK